jgi:hypothetical protein
LASAEPIGEKLENSMIKSWMWKQRSYREQFQGDEHQGGAGGAAEAQQQDAQAQEGEQNAEGETPEDNPPASEGATAQADEDGEVVITIGDEAPATTEDEIEGKPAPAWVKELRKQTREKDKRIRELEQEKAAREAAQQPQKIAVGEKPTLESCDYDAEKYGEELLAWNERKRKADEQAAVAAAEKQAAAEAWNQKVSAYKASKAALKVHDFDGAEHVVQSTLSQLQQNVILHGVDKPELVVYALGSNPAKAKELAAIKDPVKFAIAVGKLETQLKVTPRNTPPAPERQVRGSTGGATAIDNTLERLEAEADRTGDRSKVIQYKAEQRRKAAEAA